MLSVVDEVVRYTYRLRPGAAATGALIAEWHRRRFLWNEAVHQQRTGQRPTRTKLGKLLTAARKANTWLREGSQNTQACVLNTYALALNHSFIVKGRRRPTIKKRRDTLLSLEYTRNGFSVADRRLRLPKGLSIPVVWSRDLPSDPTSVRVYQDSLGHWYASFVVRREVASVLDAVGGVGIDWGVTTTATATTPAFDLPFGGHRRRCAAELAKAQRKMSRRRRSRGMPPSSGYRQARKDAAKLHKKAQQRLGLAERLFLCQECGYTDTRDRNAARTILAVAERGGTSVDDVRHSFGHLRVPGSCAV
jgi:putative transposase